MHIQDKINLLNTLNAIIANGKADSNVIETAKKKLVEILNSITV